MWTVESLQLYDWAKQPRLLRGVFVIIFSRFSLTSARASAFHLPCKHHSRHSSGDLFLWFIKFGAKFFVFFNVFFSLGMTNCNASGRDSLQLKMEYHKAQFFVVSDAFKAFWVCDVELASPETPQSKNDAPKRANLFLFNCLIVFIKHFSVHSKYPLSTLSWLL